MKRYLLNLAMLVATVTLVVSCEKKNEEDTIPNSSEESPQQDSLNVVKDSVKVDSIPLRDSIQQIDDVVSDIIPGNDSIQGIFKNMIKEKYTLKVNCIYQKRGITTDTLIEITNDAKFELLEESLGLGLRLFFVDNKAKWEYEKYYVIWELRNVKFINSRDFIFDVMTQSYIMKEPSVLISDGLCICNTNSYKFEFNIYNVKDDFASKIRKYENGGHIFKLMDENENYYYKVIITRT